MTNRRFILKTGAALAAGAAIYQPVFAQPKPTLKLVDITTPSGRMLGDELSGSLRFRGIPYGGPPIGERRFMAPEAKGPWSGLLPATDFPAAPIQRPIGPSVYVPISPSYSEDCLYLNVWMPKKAGPHPVYAWIYGGGNVAGTTSMPVFDGARMAERGMVVVSIAYRVGALGFMDVSGVLGDKYAGSGNNGLRDLILGLQWVRDNIAAFGGDPKNVTIGGQSAGAKNVISLMAAPQASSLFHNAISMSGGGQTYFDLMNGRGVTDDLMIKAGLARSNAASLLSMPAADLLAAQVKVIAGHQLKYPFRAVVDGVVLPQVPVDAIAAGASHDVPLMLGWMRDEAAFFGPAKTPDGSVLQNELANMPLSDFRAVQAGYAGVFPDMNLADQRYRSISAEEYGIPSIRVAEARAKGGGKTWLYRYDMPRADGDKAGYSIHGSELALVFDNMHDSTAAALGATGPEADRLAVVMSQAWIDFMRKGNPDPAGSLKWGAYNLATRPTFQFQARPQVVPDLDGAERHLWQSWRPVTA